jgi:hypothetical protein
LLTLDTFPGRFPFNNFRASDLHFTSQEFGREPNASVRLGAPCLIPKPDTRKGEALQVSVASGTGSPLDELLAAVDIVRCSGDGCVRHEVDGEGGDVGRADHAADWQSGAQLLATRV